MLCRTGILMSQCILTTRFPSIPTKATPATQLLCADANSPSLYTNLQLVVLKVIGLLSTHSSTHILNILAWDVQLQDQGSLHYLCDCSNNSAVQKPQQVTTETLPNCWLLHFKLNRLLKKGEQDHWHYWTYNGRVV